MSPILWRSSIRYSAGHPWQFGLSVLGIALGVAVVIAVDLSNESARRAFSLSTDAVMGKATHQIVGGSLGLDEDVYLRLRKEAGLRELAPVVEGYVAIPGHAGRIFTLLGVDPFAEAPFRSYVENSENENGQRTRERLEALLTRPGAVLISAQTAEEMALSTGDDLILEIGGKHHHATVVALLHPQDRLSQSALSNLLIADISTGQELLGMVGRLSRIDLVPAGEDTSEAGALSRIQRLLPEGGRLERAACRSDVAEQMSCR